MTKSAPLSLKPPVFFDPSGKRWRKFLSALVASLTLVVLTVRSGFSLPPAHLVWKGRRTSPRSIRASCCPPRT